MTNSSKPLLLSLKPEYANMVFLGLKTAELRKRISAAVCDRDVYIYVSSPVKELRGGFRVGEIWEDSPDRIWNMVCNIAGISKEIFDDYYAGKKVAYALEIKQVWEYHSPLSLEELRGKFTDFVIPQSYRYLKSNELRSLCRLKRSAINKAG